MGNGQHRNRRGAARSRHGPHRGGAGANDRRGATHLVPTTPGGLPDAAEAPDELRADASDDLDQALSQTPEQAQAAEIAEERFERRAGELPDAAPEAKAETEPGIEVASAAEASSDTPSAIEREAEQPPTREEPALAERASPAAAETPKAEPERRSPHHGRFERFYAPGQGPRAAPRPEPHAAPHAAPHVEQNGHPHATHATPGANGASRRLPREPLTAYTPSAAQPADEEEAAEAPSGPREDVRGPVGELIDALHDLFARDRTVATQGSASRCGICYFHFPLGELVYRETEGFYVCQPCERALAGARVPMVRRQQRL